MFRSILQNQTGKSFWNSTVIYKKQYKILRNRVCVFAHYHNTEITADVIHYLKALHKLDWSILFISTGENIDTSKFEILSETVAIIIQRKNIGYDFGSYATGYYELDPLKTTELLFCNDSVYGPFHSLQTIEDDMKQYDFWGITDSTERNHHLQSYYIQFNTKAVQSLPFQKFMGSVSPEKSKRKLIKKYEIGLTKKLHEAKLTFGSYVSSQKVLSKYSQNPTLHSNVSIHFPEELVNEGMPFIKKQVINENPGNKNLSKIKELIETLSLD